MSTYATNLAEGFSQKVVSLFFEKSIAMDVTNQDYEGEIKDKLSKLNILTFGAIATHAYVGTALSPDDATESVGELVTDQQRAYYFKIQSLQRFHSWIKNPEASLLETVAKTLAQEVDYFVLGFEGDVASGNRIGTDFTTGTVTVAVTTGVVTHSGTGFLASMVGKGFKAVGHTKWYRVAHYTSTSQIEIVDDKDDAVAAYTGGAIGAGAAFTIEALTKVQVAYNTLYGFVAKLQEKLNKAQVPATDRWLVVPPEIYTILVQTTQLIPSVSSAYQDVVLKGYVGDMCGFKVLMNTQVHGDNTDGFQVLAMHKSWLTFAMGWVESGIEDLIGDFGKAYKGLNIYGAKVVDERRKAAALLLCYV
jgi:hypothetical protein